MHSLALLAVLGTAAFANPVLNPQPVPQDTAITACERATNCETYTRPDGATGTRFIPGQEPGSLRYRVRQLKDRLTRRDDAYPQTHVTIGDKQIPWGCDVDPVAELDHLSESCKTSGQCDDSDPYEREVGYLDVITGVYAKPVETKLSIKGNGNYPAWSRNGLVAAIQAAAAGKDVIDWHRDVHWSALKPKPKSKRETPRIAQPDGPANVNPSSGSCNVAVLSSHIGLNVYSSPNTLQATMEATIGFPDKEKEKDGFCALKPGLDWGAAISGSVGGYGTGVGAFLGAISALCG